MLPYISLAVLIAAIVIAYRTNINTGIIGILLAFLLGTFGAGLTGKEIVSGFPTSTIFTLMGMTFLFSIAKSNGTLDKMARSIASLAHGKRRIIPLIFFLLSVVLAAVGPGPVVVCAIVAPLAMAVGKEKDVPDILMAVSVITGAVGGGLSQISASGIIASSLGQEQGIADYTPVFLSCVMIGAALFVLYFTILGGWKLQSSSADAEGSLREQFDRNQRITLIVVVLTILSILVLGFDTGLTAFCGGAALLLCRTTDQKSAIEGIAWSTILLIAGMGILIGVVNKAGGIDAMTTALASVMGENTAAPILCVVAGLMSSVSSASGVVMPTLIPTIGSLVEELNGAVSPTELLASIVVGSHAVTASPMSTLGALCLAAANEKTDKQKMFTQLLAIGFGSVLISALLGGLGLF